MHKNNTYVLLYSLQDVFSHFLSEAIVLRVGTIKTGIRDGGVCQVVEYLPSKCEFKPQYLQQINKTGIIMRMLPWHMKALRLGEEDGLSKHIQVLKDRLQFKLSSSNVTFKFRGNIGKFMILWVKY
jgi:hypothetical protein